MADEMGVVAGSQPVPGQRCPLCRRAGQALAWQDVPGHTIKQLTCADQAGCARARIARDASFARHPSRQDGRSYYRDQAEELCADAQKARGTPEVALVHATCGVVQALLAVAEAITQAPATDLVSVIDAAASQLDEIAAKAMEAL